MDRIGVSFASRLSAEQVQEQYIGPLRAAFESSRRGIYSNYLRRPAEGDAAPEHLIMFQVHDFQEGLRLLRVTLDDLGPPRGTTLHNLNVSVPMY